MRLRFGALAALFASIGTSAALGLSGCGGDDSGDSAYGGAGGGGNASSSGADSGTAGGGGSGPTAVLARPSRSSAIAISNDDSTLALVNPEDGSVSIFRTESETLVGRVASGSEPSSVVISPDGKSAFVANRADATVAKIQGIDGQAPALGGKVEVGAEPTGVALSPTGAKLFVAEWAESRVSVIDTATMTVETTIAVKNPFALAVTNDLDTDDADETLVVPEFFGEPTSDGEAKDSGRNGRVRLYALADYAEAGSITLAPIDSGFSPADGAPTVMTAPNQLTSIAIQKNKIYVTSISASPAAPVKFNVNVQPVVYVADLATKTEDRSNVGSANLARIVKDAVGGEPMLHLADLQDIAFIGDSDVAYVLSRGADAVQRLVYDPALGTQVGSSFNKQIDLTNAPADGGKGCKTPIGLTTAHNAPRAYANCWLSQSLGIVDLSKQTQTKTVESAPAPLALEAQAVARGKRFFFTGRGRWSNEAWSTCGSCHPGGLSDGITWSFAAGPRQTTSLDGSFSHGSSGQKQRVFNWTGIFDEVHDFERNTRDVSGGLGAITSSPSGQCGTLAEEVRDPDTLPGNLAQPINELEDRATNCTEDWDDVEAYMRSIRPPRGKQSLDPASVARGAKLFGMPTGSENNAGCVSCHGGSGWTVSRLFWTPASATNLALTTAAFNPPSAWPSSFNLHTLQIAPQPASADPTGVAQGPAQVACVLRNVGSFGIPGDSAATDLLEVRANAARAQGAGGFNVPSLYGLALGAPYLHHGQAPTLEALFDDPRWKAHLTAANPVFLTTGDAAAQKKDLIAFLLSIDATTAEQAIPVGQDGCPTSFP